MMTNPTVRDVAMEDDYDEEADSDFDDAKAEEHHSDSSDDQKINNSARVTHSRSRNKRPKSLTPPNEHFELDSGDEAALAEVKRTGRNSKFNPSQHDVVGREEEGWRARTRAMREREKVEQRKRRPAGHKTITIDVDRLWQEMNHTSPPSHHARGLNKIPEPTDNVPAERSPQVDTMIQNIELNPLAENEEMVTIRNTFKFAGVVQTQEKVVAKSSEEAQAWLSQQGKRPQKVSADGRPLRRPLRKISRFDPNYSNLNAFQGAWVNSAKNTVQPKKLNVVDKSRIDWAADVDAQGDRDELAKYAKSNKNYLEQQDTLDRMAALRTANKLAG